MGIRMVIQELTTLVLVWAHMPARSIMLRGERWFVLEIIGIRNTDDRGGNED